MKPIRIEFERPLCSFGITEAIGATIAGIAGSIGAADVGAAALGSEAAAGFGAGAAADIGAGAGLSAGLGAAGAGLASAGDVFGGAGLADLAGTAGLGDIGGTSALGFAGADTAGAAGAVADPLAGVTGAAPAVAGGAAPLGAAPIDLASAAGAAGDPLGGLAGTGDVVGASAQAAPDISTQLFGPGTTITGATSTSGGVTTPLDVSGLNAAGATSDVTSVAGKGAADIASLAGSPGGAGGDLASLSGTSGAVGGAAPSTSSLGIPASSGSVGGTTGGGSLMDSITGGITKSLTSNPLGLAAAGAGLGYNIIQGQKLTANEQALQNAAGSQAAQGAQLQQYLTSGTLPPGLQAQVDQAKQAAKASIISGYAARGQNANPAQNSALAQELAAVDTNAVAMQGQLATNLLNSGLTETNMSNQLYEALVQMDQTQAKSMGAAIANFSTALAGGPKAIVLGNSGTTTA